MNPTASKSGLLLQCGRPFSDDVEVDIDEGDARTIYGVQFHANMRALAEGVEMPFPGPPAYNAKEAAWPHLQRWLADEGLVIVGAEKSLATDLRGDARECVFHEEGHWYETLSGEIAGTYDLLARGGDRLVVLDYKTGDWGNWLYPSKLPQLLTLALFTNATEVAVMHAPRDLPPVIYCEPLAGDAIELHRTALNQAMGRINDGSLRPGPECVYCPAKISCPAKDSSLVKRGTALVHSMVEGGLRANVSLGDAHLFLQEFARLDKRLRETIKERVMGGEEIYRRDGKKLTILEKSVRNLSMASIVRALGKEEGEKVIAELTAKGCVESGVRSELHAVKGDKDV